MENTRNGETAIDPIGPSQRSAAPKRAQAFREDIAAMHLRDPAVGRDLIVRVAAEVIMAGAVTLGIVAIAMSTGTSDPLAQRDAIVIGLFAVTLALVGAAVFLRYSLAHFLRFWMARLAFEQATQTAQMVEALEQFAAREA